MSPFARALVALAIAIGLASSARAHDPDEDEAIFRAEATVELEDEEPASTTRLSSRDVLSVPRRTAEDALRLVPGVTLVQHGSEGKGYQFFIRGFDAVHGADLEVTVEGVPLNEWSNVHGHGYLDLGFIPPELIDSVEVTKGPFSLDQGAFALAGTARYRLGVADDARGLRAAYTVGSTNRHRGLVTFTPRDGDGRDFVAVEALHDDGFGSRRRIDRGALLGRLRFFDDARGTLTGTLALHAASFQLPGMLRNQDVDDGRIGFYGAYDRGMHGASRRALVSLEYERRTDRGETTARISGGLRSLELLENYTGFLLDPEHGDRRAQAHRAASFGASLDHVQRVHERVSLLFGLGVRGDVFAQDQTHVDFDTGEALSVQRDLAATQSVTHAMLGLRARVGEVFRLTAGARLDLVQIAARDRIDPERSDRGLLVVASPRVVASFPVSHHVEPTFAYGRGFRPPEARAFTSFMPDRIGVGTDVYGGGEATHTASDAFELGARFYVSRFLYGEISAFATLVARESIYDHLSGTNLALNRTRRLGGELRLASRPLDWLELVFDGTGVDARFPGSGAPVPLAPRFFGTFRAIATHGSGVRGGLRLMGLTPRPLPHGAMGSSYFTLDLTAGYTFKWLRLDLDVENLTNRRNREGEYHFASHWARGATPSEIPVLQSIAGPPFNARLTISIVY